MSVINNLQLDDEGFFATGTFQSQSLFSGEMRVSLFACDGVTEDDALRCIQHYNGLTDKPAMVQRISEMVTKFFLYMYDEWHDFAAVYGDIAASLEPIMQAHQNGASLIDCLSKPTLYVFPQRAGEIGYGLECECPWEPEHMCSIMIRNDQVLYVGPSEGEDPWGDEGDYYCIWE